MIEEVDKNVYLALLAEKSGSFQDMRFFLEKYILKKHEDISVDERNLLSVAYKNIVSTKRHCLRTILAYENKEKQLENSENIKYIKEYQKILETDLVSTCEYICLFIETYLFPFASDNSSKAFYLKIIGDYYRYIAENIENEKKSQFSDKSLKAYNEARDFAKSLSIIDPVRLGLALNLSVFYYEIINNQETGCQIAKKMLDLIIKEIDNIEKNDERVISIYSILSSFCKKT